MEVSVFFAFFLFACTGLAYIEVRCDTRDTANFTHCVIIEYHAGYFLNLDLSDRSGFWGLDLGRIPVSPDRVS